MIGADDAAPAVREAGDILLLDRHLGAVAPALREGRRTFHNLQAVVGYLLAGSVAELVVVAGAIPALRGSTIPLTAVQLLWINVVTDGLPAIALVGDVAPGDPLIHPGRGRRRLDRHQVGENFWRGALLGGALVALATWSAGRGGPAPVVATQLVVGLVFGQLVLPLVVRAQRWPFETGWSANRPLIAISATSSLAQLALVSWAPTRTLLGLRALSPSAWGELLAVLCPGFVVMTAARPAGVHAPGRRRRAGHRVRPGRRDRRGSHLR